MDFTKALHHSKLANEHNDCTVKAISIACDVPYKVAHKALERQGRKARRGSLRYQQKRAVESLGFEMRIVVSSAKTITTLPRCSEVQNGYFMAYVKRHVAAVVNGKVEDWTEGRRHRLQEVYRIVPVATRKERKALMKALFA